MLDANELLISFSEHSPSGNSACAHGLDGYKNIRMFDDSMFFDLEIYRVLYKINKEKENKKIIYSLK